MPNKGCNEISRMKLQCNNSKSWKLFWKKNPALHNLSPTLRAKIKVKIHQGCARLHCILILTFPWSSVHYWGPWQESGSTVQQQWSVVANSKNPPKISLKKSWNWLIRLVPAIECEAHVMAGNGSFVNLLNLARKNLWKHIKLNFFLRVLTIWNHCEWSAGQY